MKKKILFSVFVVITCVFIFSFYNPAKTANLALLPQPNDDKFLIGCMQSYDYITLHDALGLNVTHKYDNSEPGQIPGHSDWLTPISWMTNEHLFDAVPAGTIQTKLNEIYSHNQSKILWMRPKIEWLAYGKSSVYKAAPVPLNDDYWFYSFNNNDIGESIPDNSQWGDGQLVMHCRAIPTNPDPPGFVVRRLKANTEQCHRDNSTAPWGSPWQGDSQHDWFVKPRLRADRDFIINQANAEVPICTLYVKKQDGMSDADGTPVIIKAKNFQRNYTTPNLYNGDYIDSFYFVQDQDPTFITFTGDLQTVPNPQGYVPWFYNARGTCASDPPNLSDCNHADYQIYWSGNCDMWLDYIKVDNDVANDLLSNNPLNPNWVRYEQWLQDETTAAMFTPSGASDPVVFSFYIELLEFSHTPCMAYVNNRIQYYSGGKLGLMGEPLCIYQALLALRDRGNLVNPPDKVKRTFYDRTNFPYIFVGDPYPIIAAKTPCDNFPQWSEVPNTLPVYQTTNSGNPYLFAVPSAPSDYDAWLQSLFDSAYTYGQGGIWSYPQFWYGDMCYLTKHANALSKLTNKPYIAMLQAHQWNINGGEVDREPTNEEADLMANLAVSYGAKGIIWWWFPSFDNGICDHSFGLINIDGTPRQYNLYGEQKWQKYQDIVQRLNIWGPTLMSFNNTQTNSYIYRLETERNQLLNYSYIGSIASYRAGNPMLNCPDWDNPYPPPPDEPAYQRECQNYTYLQAATFENTEENNTNYFMIVNRRCSPYIDESSYDNIGGKRKIKILFTGTNSQLEGANSWKITEIGNPDWFKTFDKTAYLYVDLGEFMPGEGRLYKMEPTVKSGGILVGNENITSGQTFTCEDTVYTNGYSLTIENDVTINFSDSAKFIVHGGTFQIGDPEYSQTNNINIGGGEGTTWKGFAFDLSIND